MGVFRIYPKNGALVIRYSFVRGFKLQLYEVRVSAYADNIAMFCTTYEGIVQLVNTVKRFCAVSGSAVNWKKCLGFWHGKWSSNPGVFMNMKWETTKKNALVCLWGTIAIASPPGAIKQ